MNFRNPFEEKKAFDLWFKGKVSFKERAGKDR
jgi:hypothetical protein